MRDYEKIGHLRRELEDIRKDLSQRIDRDMIDNGDLKILHERVSRAIKALSAQG